MEKEFQCRSEEHGMSYFDTIQEAIEATMKDKTIWKISFNSSNEANGRIALVRDARTKAWEIMTNYMTPKENFV